jgi:DNA-binding Lrp family transcriptional regulator
MALAKSGGSGEDASSNVKTGQLARMITEIGPNISEIARQLGQFKESVRYRYKEKLLSKGFAVHVAVDHEKLGLKRVIILVDFADEYRSIAHKVMRLLSDEGYLVSFEKVLPDGKYIVHCSVPEEVLPQYRELFASLESRGIFRSLEFHTFQWFRNPPMKTTMYDFDEGAWDFDWSTENKLDRHVAAQLPSGREKFDMIDLLILKQLQMDGNRTLAEMAESLRINYKTLTWHFRKHIQERKLIKGYVIKWMGTTYDYKAERSSNKKHTYLWVVVMFSDLDQARRLEVMARLNQLPFIWSEAVGDMYEAELIFPIESLTEGLQYIAEVIADTRSTAKYYIVDQTNANAFTIIPRLFDEEKQTWRFEATRIVRDCEKLLLEIREGTGRPVPSDVQRP